MAWLDEEGVVVAHLEKGGVGWEGVGRGEGKDMGACGLPGCALPGLAQVSNCMVRPAFATRLIGRADGSSGSFVASATLG